MHLVYASTTPPLVPSQPINLLLSPVANRHTLPLPNLISLPDQTDADYSTHDGGERTLNGVSGGETGRDSPLLMEKNKEEGEERGFSLPSSVWESGPEEHSRMQRKVQQNPKASSRTRRWLECPST